MQDAVDMLAMQADIAQKELKNRTKDFKDINNIIAKDTLAAVNQINSEIGYMLEKTVNVSQEANMVAKGIEDKFRA
jgi:hypothetical protein